MAVISSHTLNGTDGTHAGGITVTLCRLGQVNEIMFETVMDDGGRLNQEIAPDSIDPSATYELVFETSSYWNDRGISGAIPQMYCASRCLIQMENTICPLFLTLTPIQFGVPDNGGWFEHVASHSAHALY